jgi:hypothetical protein
MSLQTIELSDEIIQRAKALTGKRSARAAVAAVVDGAGHTPDAKTRAFRARHRKGTTTVRGGKAAAGFMRQLLGE